LAEPLALSPSPPNSCVASWSTTPASRKAQKHDGLRQRVELSNTLAISEDRLDEILLVDEALHRLA
jgi:hypothetical protein